MYEFFKRVAFFFALALLAYALFLLFDFPKYWAPPSAFAQDMYDAVNYAVDGSDFASQLTYPRPVYFEMQLLAGQFGFEGSMIFLDGIVLLDLALLLAIVERFVFRTAIAGWIAFGTLMLAMVGPGFFSQPGYDVGFQLAMLFGLLGILIWEWHRPAASMRSLQTWTTLAGALALFCLSTLSNEGFIPALVLYGVVAAYRERRTFPLAGTVAILPLIAVAVSAAWSHATGSSFVDPNAGPDDPYHIDLRLSSLLNCAAYYFGPLANKWLLLLFAFCAAGIALRRRWWYGALFLLAGALTLMPYLLLPNHIEELYQWTGFSLMVVLLPLALVPEPGETRDLRRMMLSSVTLVAVLLAIASQSTSYADDKDFYISVMQRNRDEVAAVRLLAPQIGSAKSILVCGLPMAESPWQSTAAFVSNEAGFAGTWTIAIEADGDTPEDQDNAKAIDYKKLKWSNYDFILVFNYDDGSLVGFYRPRDLKAVIAANGWERLSNARVIKALTERAQR